MEKLLIVECKTSEEANKMEAEGYRYDKYSETRDVYIMVRRRK